MKYRVLEGGMIGGILRGRGEIVEAPEGDPYGYARLSSLSAYEEPEVRSAFTGRKATKSRKPVATKVTKGKKR